MARFPFRRLLLFLSPFCRSICTGYTCGAQSKRVDKQTLARDRIEPLAESSIHPLHLTERSRSIDRRKSIRIDRPCRTLLCLSDWMLSPSSADRPHELITFLKSRPHLHFRTVHARKGQRTKRREGNNDVLDRYVHVSKGQDCFLSFSLCVLSLSMNRSNAASSFSSTPSASDSY